ncbi:MAG: VCBS repeat-containing protein [Acidobacteriaceae bacterium]|nr:VCBS repeat-containing protein [Acidobacteriaceae bacterium]MBV9498414.1 VCBS repeat-containing protein [Acidobacteriaceae bacterium]
MKQVKLRPGVNRREFLAATAALPLLGSLRGTPAFAEEPRHTPPYLALKQFISPGNDEFPGEKTAADIAAALLKALESRELPLAPSATGHSPCPSSYKSLAPDLDESAFDSSDTAIESGWKAWVQSLGSVRRAEFHWLPSDVVRYEVASEAGGKLFHRVGLWNQRWTEGRLTSFVPVEEHVASATRPFFRDVTAAVFEKAASFREQLAKGVPYWRAKLDPACGIDLYGSNGIAVGDIDNDGYDEVYVCQPGGLPNRLYKYNRDGYFSDITGPWGAGVLDDTSSALFVDLRNTGSQDLVVLRGAGPVLFLNEGTHFRLRDDAFHFATPPAGAFTGMAASDFDRDGKLDLYLCCYVYFQSEAQYTYASPYHDAQNGPPNFLFRNRLNTDGTGTFEDVTAESGMNQNNNRFSFAPAWCDFNDDGWPDLFVANDFGRKNLYVNKNGHFRDLAAAAGVEDIGPGMSASWFDYDRDGRPDLYVANMWTAAGQRIVADPNFVPSHDPAARDAYRGHTMGNSLFRNRGDGTFEDSTTQQHVNFGRWAWASGGDDFDNDGSPEIFVTSGMLTNESTTDLNSFFWREVVARSPVKAQPSAAYENGWNALNQFIREDYSWNGREPNVLHVRRGDRYFDFSGVSGLDFAEDSRAFAVTDFDGDGRPDIILKSRMGPQLRVLQNNCAGGNHSIAFRLKGTKSNRDAIGARVEVDGQTKWLEAGSGFLSQHSKRLTFGLAEANTARKVRIEWPSGDAQEFDNLRADSTYSVTEGSHGFTSQPFPARRVFPLGPADADNGLRLHDTWFLEPIPLPERQPGPGLLLLLNSESSPSYSGLQVTKIDLSQFSDRREQYALFRRYLFDWRTDLKTPLALLLDGSGAAVKVYAELPSRDQVKTDLDHIARVALGDVLPFAGAYVGTPHRDFFKFGAAFLWSGYPEQALPYLERVLAKNPSNARVLVLVGQIHLRANRSSSAEKYFREALEANPNDAEAWSGLGDICASAEKPGEALVQYEKALSLKPDLLYTLLNAGQAADKLNDPARAEAYYRRALELDSQSAEAMNGLGLASAKQGRTSDARQFFEKAISVRRDYAEAINNLGVLYMKQGQVNDAIAAFEYGIRVAPSDDILYLNLGRTYVQLGKPDRARQVMQELLDHKPDSATARRALQDLNGR